MAVVLVMALLAGCDSLPGKPKESDRPINPSQVKTFAALYGENCAGCHGAGGSFGAACDWPIRPTRRLVDDATLTRTSAREWREQRCRRLRTRPEVS